MQELLELNEEGLFPLPEEKEEDFLLRVKRFKEFSFAPVLEKAPFPLEDRVKKPRLEWSRIWLFHLFGIGPQEVIAFYQNKGLSLFQGGATWIFEKNDCLFSIIQLRKRLKHGSYFFLREDEVLSHEIVHSIRAALDSPKMEEIFAYLASSSTFRKIFGPLIEKTYEPFVFFLLYGTGLFLSFFDIKYSIHFTYGAILWVACGLFRLLKKRWIFNKAWKKLKKICKENALKVLFRMTDEEIFLFAKSTLEEIRTYISSQEELRWKVLRHAYF